MMRRDAESRVLKLTEFVTANELATMMDVPVTQVIGTCMSIGIMVLSTSVLTKKPSKWWQKNLVSPPSSSLLKCKKLSSKRWTTKKTSASALLSSL